MALSQVQISESRRHATMRWKKKSETIGQLAIVSSLGLNRE